MLPSRMNALVGYTGFVGVNLVEHMNSDTLFINSKNTTELLHREYDIIYYCGVYAEKWKANAHPDSDKENIDKIIYNLSTIKCKKFVLISTVDVLDCSFSQNETDEHPIYSTHAYGKHRRYLEEWCLKNFDECYIFRLPALFGHGLKKNALYDMINNNNIHKLSSHWKFQWYNIEWLYEDIQSFITTNNSMIVHLITPSITLGSIHKLFFADIQLGDSGAYVNYNLKSQYYTQRTQEDVFVAMKQYIDSVREHNNLLVSELAWKSEKSVIPWLNSRGIKYIEAVPSKYNWDMNEYNSIYSAQSILYGIPIQIFSEQPRFLSILEEKLSLLQSKNTKVIIFGSPSQRIYNGEDASTLFTKAGDLCKKYNIVLCLENNSSLYGCNWITHVREALTFVKTLNHSHVKINLDTGSVLMENEQLLLTADDIFNIGHVQISFPHLGLWDNVYTPQLYNIVKDLHKYGYIGKISLEMKSSVQPLFRSVISFLRFMENTWK